jgi:hypothetical protein
VKWIFVLTLFLLPSTLGQSCPVNLARLPTAPPKATLSLRGPDELTGGVYSLKAALSALGEIRLVRHEARLRQTDQVYPSQSVVCTEGVLHTAPLGPMDNGEHTLKVEAYVYYRVFEGGSWQLRLALLEQRQVSFALYLPWKAGPEAAAGLLKAEWQAGKEGGIEGEKTIGVWGVVRTLNPSLLSVLREIKEGGFTDCNPVGICAVVPPARIRLINDDPSRFAGVVATGCLKGGVISGCQRYQDSRVSNVGTRIAGGLLAVEGIRHGYLLVGEGVEAGGEIQIIELPLSAIRFIIQTLTLNEAFRSGQPVQP